MPRLTAIQLANDIGVHTNTVARWLEAGTIPGRRIGSKGSRWRISPQVAAYAVWLRLWLITHTGQARPRMPTIALNSVPPHAYLPCIPNTPNPTTSQRKPRKRKPAT